MLDIPVQIIVLLLVFLGAAVATWAAQRRSWLFRRALPIDMQVHCSERLESGAPVQVSLAFSNPSNIGVALAIAIDYAAGKSVVEQITVAPGQFSYRIPEPQRVKTVRIGADGYAGVLVHM